MVHGTTANSSEPATDSIPSRRSIFALTLGLIGLTLFVYARVITFDFVNWDDTRFIVKNMYYPQGLTTETVWWALTSHEQGFWIPTTRLSFLLDGHLWKMRPSGFHFTSLLLHIVNSVLCFSVCRRLFDGIWKSFLIAAIFAIHPLHTESVCWVNDRNDLVCGLFWLLAMSAYLSYCRTLGFGKYLLLTVLMSLSVMSKPQAATFPFAMLLLDLWPLSRLKTSRWTSKNTENDTESARFVQHSFTGLCLEKLPLIVLCVFFMGLTWFYKNQTGNLLSEEVFPLDVRLANAIDAYAIYARQMVWPNDLEFFYPHTHLLNAKQGIPVSQWGLSLAIVISISILAIFQMRRRPYLIVGWCWFLGILVPAIGLVQVGEYARADRYMYIPMLGLTIVFVYSLEEILSHLPARRSMAVVSGLIVVGGLTVMTVPQAESWRNTEAMCRHALSVDESNYMAYTLISQDVLKRSTRNKEEKKRNAEISLKYLAKSKEIMPRFAPTEQAIGLTLVALGRDDEACEAFRKSLDIDPNYSLSYLNIAIVSARQGNYQQAIESLLEVDRREATVSAFTKEVAWVKLSSYYRRLGEEGRSLEYDRKVYALNPRRVDALERIAWSLATSNDDNIRDADQALELASKLNRLHRERNPKALDTLAAAYAEAGNFSEALEVSAKAREVARRAKNEKLLQEIEERQQLYQAGKPFRQKITPGKA